MYIDIFIVVVAVWAVVGGWRHGLLKEVVSAGGWIAGLVVAVLCYKFLLPYLSVDGSKLNITTSIIAFLLLCVLVPMVLGVVANMLTHTLRRLHFGLPNSLGGAAVSLLKYALLLSFAFNVMSLPGMNLISEERTASSRLFKPTASLLSAAKDFISDVRSKPGGHPYDGALSPDSRRVNDSTIIVDFSKKTQGHKP